MLDTELSSSSTAALHVCCLLFSRESQNPAREKERYSKSSKREKEVFKIQQERAMTYSKSSKREKERYSKSSKREACKNDVGVARARQCEELGETCEDAGV